MFYPSESAFSKATVFVSIFIYFKLITVKKLDTPGRHTPSPVQAEVWVPSFRSKTSMSVLKDRLVFLIKYFSYPKYTYSFPKSA